MRQAIRFLLDGAVQVVVAADPTRTLLEWLRYDARRTGTKEGCAEGDCGACTVLVGELEGDRIAWRVLNACILFLPMLDGRALMTVESLGADDDLNPIQQAMVDCHGSQCGFCTPGFVMALQGRRMGAAGVCDVPVTDALAGNLCRCTGYGPIIEAGAAVGPAAADPGLVEALRAIQRDDTLDIISDDPFGGGPRRWIAPPTQDALAEAVIAHPDAQIVAGATDIGLWVTKQQRTLPTIISIGAVEGFRAIAETAAGVTLMAGARYVDVHAALARIHPDLGELIRRIGGPQIRSAGTIGGNIANGSPIGDMPPAFIALGATLTLRRGDARRTMKLEDYFLAYGQQDRQPGEYVESVYVPRPDADTRVRIVKLSKRFDSDISAVCGAFALRIENDVITSARVAFGGMAGVPRRAKACEAALVGAAWSAEALDRAADALLADFDPLTDVRGSAAYRHVAAANLLRRLWLEWSASAAPSLLALEPIDG